MIVMTSRITLMPRFRPLSTSIFSLVESAHPAYRPFLINLAKGTEPVKFLLTPGAGVNQTTLHAYNRGEFCTPGCGILVEDLQLFPNEKRAANKTYLS